MNFAYKAVTMASYTVKPVMLVFLKYLFWKVSEGKESKLSD